MSYPVIVGFMLPERFACSPQQQIRFPGRSPFDPVRYLGQRHLRQYQHVHMVGHDDPSVQLIKLPALAGANRFHYLARDSRIAQPQRPMALAQRTILCGERVAGSCINDVGRRNGQRPMQAPSHKQILTIRMKMRQPSSILGHRACKSPVIVVHRVSGVSHSFGDDLMAS